MFEVIGSSHGVVEVVWPNRARRCTAEVAAVSAGAAPEVLEVAVTQLSEFAAGERTVFDVAFDVGGSGVVMSAFRRAVTDEVASIPFGSTCTYADIARRVNGSRFGRPVGQAVAANMFGLFVPCHRVVPADGSLGGFAGGVQLKLQLLEFEMVSAAAH